VTGVVSRDRAHAVWLVAQETASDRRQRAPLRLPGLDDTAGYRLVIPPPQRPAGRTSPEQTRLFADGIRAPGALLSHVGITLPLQPPESALVIEAVRLVPA
jgi:alpha-galactosidase